MTQHIVNGPKGVRVESKQHLFLEDFFLQFYSSKTLDDFSSYVKRLNPIKYGPMVRTIMISPIILYVS